jgi:DNA-binding GntR family transcriptional regulator
MRQGPGPGRTTKATPVGSEDATARGDELRYRTASEHAFRILKQWINDGALRPGSAIDQAELSSTLGMSRVPIRTALERLASEGLVTLTPHRGAVVTSISVQELRDLYFVRRHLEGVATELAAQHMAQDDFDALERILTTTEEQVSAGDLEGFLKSNRAFHLRIYAAAANAVLARVIESLWDLGERYRRSYLQLPARARESTNEHRRLFELLRRRDVAAAGAYMRDHNDKTMRVLLDHFQQTGGGAP